MPETICTSLRHFDGLSAGIKHNRKPASGISFQTPNLPTLIADCIALGDSLISGPSAGDQETRHEP